MAVVLILMEVTSKFFLMVNIVFEKNNEKKEMYDNKAFKDSETVFEEVNSLISICLWIYLACASTIYPSATALYKI